MAKTKTSAAEKETEKTDTATTSGGTNSLVFAVLGLALGLIVGFMVTNSLNQSAGGARPGAVSGNEKLPEGHPDTADMEQQAKAAKQFAELNKNDFDAQLKVATFFYSALHRLEEAKPYFLKAHELKPDEFEPLVQLGNVTFDLSQEKADPKLMPEAASWYEKALAKKPDDINVRTDYGLTFQLREPPDYNTALQQYDKSLAIEPKHTPTLYNKAKAFIAMKKIKEAEQIYTQLTELNAQKEMLEQLRKDLEGAGGKAIAGTPPKEPDKRDSVQIPTH